MKYYAQGDDDATPHRPDWWIERRGDEPIPVEPPPPPPPTPGRDDD